MRSINERLATKAADGGRPILCCLALLAVGLFPASVLGQPTNVSVSPSSGTGASQTFAFVTSSPGGYGNISTVYMLFNWWVSGSSGCYVQYVRATNLLYLLNDQGTIWSSGVAPGTTGTLSNSQCQVNTGTATVSGAGNNLTVNVPMTFSSTFVGPQKTFLDALDNGGLWSNWQQMGSWTGISASSTLPTVTAVNPSSGSGFGHVFQFTMSDVNGYRYIGRADFLINRPLSGAGACYFWYYPNENTIYLLNDSGGGWAGYASLGSGGTIENSQCLLDPAASSASGSGNTLTVNLGLTFKPGFAGARDMYVGLTDRAGGYVGFTQYGTWTVADTTAPTNVSVSPSSGSGTTQTFTFMASSSGGFANISTVYMLFNWWVSGSSGCYVQYVRATNLLYLENDQGTGWSNGVTPGTVGTLLNSQCQVNTVTATVTHAGNNLTVNVPVTFSSTFVGLQPMFLDVLDDGGLTSNWQQMGSWTAYSASTQLPTVALTPSSGTGLSQVFKFTMSDVNGYRYIGRADIVINSTLSGVGACYFWYYPNENQIWLSNDTGGGWVGARNLGSGAVIENSQCQLDPARSSVGGSGNTLTVNLALTFKLGFAGARNVYAALTDRGGGYTGGIQYGTWTVAPLSITTISPLLGGLINTFYSLSLGANAGTPPYYWSVGTGLPPGITLSVDGVLSGASTAASTYNFTVQLTDSTTQVASKTFSLKIWPPPLTITTPSPLPTGTALVNYSQQLTHSGGSPNYTWGFIDRPSWMGWQGDGLIWGTPPAPGNFFLDVNLTDANGTISAHFDFAIGASTQVVISTTSLLTPGFVGASYNQALAATGGTLPYTWSQTGGSLPPGVILSNNSLNGTPTASGTYGFNLKVADSASHNASQSFSLTITSALTITISSPLTSGMVGSAYSANLAAAGGTSPYAWAIISGALPPGLNLSSSGTLSGTPTTTNTYSFTVRVTDYVGVNVSQALSLTISPNTLTTPTGVFRETSSGRVKLLSFHTTGVVDAGGTLVGTPVSAKTAIGDTYVTGLDSSGTPWINVYSANSQTWLGWQSSGGTFVGKPTIVVGANGTAYSCYRDSTGQYWLLNYTRAGGFGARQDLSGRTFSGDPAIGAAPDGSLYIAGTDASGAVWSGHVSPHSVFGGWIFLGGSMAIGPSLAVGADGAAYLIANDQSSVAWMGRLADSTWSGWFTTAARSTVIPAVGSSGLTVFAAIVDGSGAVWTCSIAVGNKVCGQWTSRQGSFGAVQGLSASVQGGDFFLAARDLSGNGWWFQLSARQWTFDGPAVTAGSTLIASNVTPSAVNLIEGSGNTCGDMPFYYNKIYQVDNGVQLYAEGFSETWVEGNTAFAWFWGLNLTSSMSRNGSAISTPDVSYGYLVTDDGFDAVKAIDAYYQMSSTLAHYKQTAVHAWDGSAVGCTVINSPLTSTYERDFPVGAATPVITSISPTSAQLGQTVAVTVTGMNFLSYNGLMVLNINGDAADPLIGFTETSVSDTQIQGNLSIDGSAQVGDRSVYLTSTAGPSNSVTFTVQGDPTPIITSITPNNFDAGSLDIPTTIFGSGFGTNPVISISGNGVSARLDLATPPTDTQISALFDATVDADPSVNVSIYASGTDTHNFTPQTGAQRQSPPKPVTVNSTSGPISISYRAFIRANWIQAPTNCLAIINLPFFGSKFLYYRGDSRDFALYPTILHTIPASSPYRGATAATIALGTPNPLIGAAPSGGITRQYDTQSLIPDSGGLDPTGSGQIVDPAIVDRERTCNGGKGLVQKKDDVPVSNVSATQNSDQSVSVHFNGSVYNPIEFGGILAPVTWDFIVLISADGSTASINGIHTCYPAHELVVNGKYLWRYGPNYSYGASQSLPAAPNAADRDVTFVGGCLAFRNVLIPMVNEINLR